MNTGRQPRAFIEIDEPRAHHRGPAKDLDPEPKRLWARLAGERETCVAIEPILEMTNVYIINENLCGPGQGPPVR
jgi:hypothetical protein